MSSCVARSRLSSLLVILLIFFEAPIDAGAQTAGAPAIAFGNHIVLSGSLRTRIEAWNWFEGDADGDYTFSGSLIRLGLSQSTAKRDWQIELAAPVLLGLPPDATGPGAQGQSGLGAAYFAANRQTQTAAAFVKRASVRFKNIARAGNQSINAGRIEFTEGTEVAPQNMTLASVKRDRIAQRLIGNFGFTHVGRSFDGVQWVAGRDTLNLTAFAGRPTEGVFQVDGWGELGINLFYGALTALPRAEAEWRVFAVGYSDYRDDVLKTDSRRLDDRRADIKRIDIASFGGHYLRLVTLPAGSLDCFVWGVLQTGRWGALAQRSGAVAAEIGWQPPSARLAPWIRGGYNYGSGDDDPHDATHGTFFQVLPTPRAFARFPFYGMMNNADAFGELMLRPTPTFSVRTDVHALRLAEREDLWYLGGGAFQAETFGYTGRPSNGRSDLATLYDASADVALGRHTSITGYYSYAAGKGVIRRIYPTGPNGRFGYLELLVRF